MNLVILGLNTAIFSTKLVIFCIEFVILTQIMDEITVNDPDNLLHQQ